MKTITKTITTLLTLITINLITINLSAQDPPPPPPGHNSGGNVPGGGASIAGGIGILLALGAAYGAKKIYNLKQEQLEG